MDTKQKVLVGAAVASTAAAGAAFAFKSAGTDSKLTKVACNLLKGDETSLSGL
ncbi:hypothetical protein [Rhizobium sp. 9140]|uniref:hypothetical protein n=1 Tax=Rhizobium sp. 9140 TaxID=1761900 RepID=UPI000793389E|nr:hypothetical protein [Rhizobium sp. 9140]CZT38033.1 hypothetical protein GA0004734_00049100 [Rhizobium sp. 9140]